MDTQFREKIEEEYVKRDTDVKPGDTVKVHLRITEAGKERVQIFEGVVISVKGSGLSKMITVRKISYGVGVEKILPVNSPMIKKIDVVSRGNVRRSKLYYMRKKIGKRSLDAGFDEQFEAVLEEEGGDEVQVDEEAEKKDEEEPSEKKDEEKKDEKSAEEVEAADVKEKESEEKEEDPAAQSAAEKAKEKEKDTSESK